MKESLLYIFRAARSPFKVIGGNGSCTGAGQEERHEMSCAAGWGVSPHPSAGTPAMVPPANFWAGFKCSA